MNKVQLKCNLVQIEGDRGLEWCNTVFRNFLANKNIKYYSRKSN